MASVEMVRAVLVLVLSLVFIKPSAAVPVISFPINSQVPPVARIGQPYSFIFSQSTFTASSAITYTLSNPPKWLSLDSEARRLFGTPTEADVAPGTVVGVPVGLVATDSSGSTTLDTTLVVSRSPAPLNKIPLDQQVPRFGIFSSPSSILLPPQTPFALDLAPDTFVDSSNSPLNYYAVMADHTPLPAWITFDAGKLSFAGQTPPAESLIQPPQPFSFQLIASDVVGFAAASMAFNFVVGIHGITTDQTVIVLNTTVGSPVSYTLPRESIKVDGKPSAPGDVFITATSDIPPWLSIDKNSWRLNGTPPETAGSTNFTITLGDTYSDTLNITVNVEIASGVTRTTGLFKGNIPVLTAIPGKRFSFDLSPYLSNPGDTEIAVEADPSNSWIQTEPGTDTISSLVPQGLAVSSIDIKVKAKSKSSENSDSLPLTVRVQAAGTTASTESTRPTTSVSITAPQGAADSKNTGINIVLLAVLLPTLFLVIAVICVVLCWLRRRKHDQPKSKLSTRDISGPLPGSFVVTASGLPASESLPEVSERLNSNTSLITTSTPERKGYIESREAYMRNSSAADVPRPLATVKMLPARKPSSATTHKVVGGGRQTFLNSGTFTSLRLGKHSVISRSLSSISETSWYEETVGMMSNHETNNTALRLFGNQSRGSFRDVVEINIPSLGERPSTQPTPESTNPSEESRSRWGRSNSASSPQQSMSIIGSDPDTLPLRTEPKEEESQQRPTWPVRKFAWPWSRAGGGSKKEKTSLFARAANKQRSLRSPSSFETASTHSSHSTQRSNNHNTSRLHRSPELSLPPLAKLPSLPNAARPVTRKGPVAGQTFGSSPAPKQAQARGRSETITSTPTAHPRGLPISDTFAATPNWELAPRDSLGISYEDLVKKSPFHPSRTWSTVPFSEDHYNETAAVTPQREGKHTGLPPTTSSFLPNWTLLGESPIIKDWVTESYAESEAPAKPDAQASSGLPQSGTRDWFGTSVSTYSHIIGGDDSSQAGQGLGLGSGGLGKPNESQMFSSMISDQMSESDYACLV
ncbi:hypothetical protein B0T19DRAFT_442400 [Cercophora scortea]|uniref:Dystroglycan-type cadherin-like domain-containing protein n=1 Tax=Cercophora scortea TaxID=314031 RepID=A0AAE0INQ2_9PEZI|nr:hypothetical protein B0T19DRAFT_442400 [Cercophora scortea]